jgi:hypothetical protein
VLLAVAGMVLFRSRWGALRRLAAGLARGCSALRRPRAYLRAVTPWQLASRLLRAASLACFLLAFGLPATAAAIGLVMVAQGGGRLLPFAPASAAATVAVLAAGFTGATGTHPDVGTLTAFVVGTSTLLTVAGMLLAAAISVWMYGGSARSAWNALRGHGWSVPTRSPRTAPAARGALGAGR